MTRKGDPFAVPGTWIGRERGRVDEPTEEQRAATQAADAAYLAELLIEAKALVDQLPDDAAFARRLLTEAIEARDIRELQTAIMTGQSYLP